MAQAEKHRRSAEELHAAQAVLMMSQDEVDAEFAQTLGRLPFKISYDVRPGMVAPVHTDDDELRLSTGRGDRSFQSRPVVLVRHRDDVRGYAGHISGGKPRSVVVDRGQSAERRVGG